MAFGGDKSCFRRCVTREESSARVAWNPLLIFARVIPGTHQLALVTHGRKTTMAVKTLLFASIVLVALSMGPTWAHLLEMPAKLTLSRSDYFVVQQIYRGWAWSGVFIFSALASTSALAVLSRGEGMLGRAAAASAACIVSALVVFFAYTFPANQATANWTLIPDHWTTLRRQWEYAHAAEALLYFAALLLLAGGASLQRP
jgi:hypothetical protein